MLFLRGEHNWKADFFALFISLYDAVNNRGLARFGMRVAGSNLESEGENKDDHDDRDDDVAEDKDDVDKDYGDGGDDAARVMLPVNALNVMLPVSCCRQ